MLLQFNPNQLRPLEIIQNKAMRIILGCPATAKIEVLRKELHLPSIVCRVKEIACRTMCRMVCHGADDLKQAVVNVQTQANMRNNYYLRRLYSLLLEFHLLDTFVTHLYTQLCPMEL